MVEQRPDPEFREGTRYLSAALRFAGGTIMFMFGGLALDRFIGTTPFLTIAGTLVGAGLSFLSVYREYTASMKNRDLKQWSGRRRDSD